MSPSETEAAGRRLVQKLRGPDAGGRARAAICLSEMGEETLPVLGELIDALNDPDPAVRRVAAWVLGYVGLSCPEAVRALDRAATDSDGSVRKAARAALTVSSLRHAA
jgi:HEAT repeat protein